MIHNSWPDDCVSCHFVIFLSGDIEFHFMAFLQCTYTAVRYTRGTNPARANPHRLSISWNAHRKLATKPNTVDIKLDRFPVYSFLWLWVIGVSLRMAVHSCTLRFALYILRYHSSIGHFYHRFNRSAASSEDTLPNTRPMSVVLIHIKTQHVQIRSKLWAFFSSLANFRNINFKQPFVKK